MVVGPKTDKYPVILHYDDNGNPKRIAESNVLTVSSITATTVSAASYLGAPIGGVTAIGQLADVDPQIVNTPGNILIVGVGNAVSGIASSTFATQASAASLDGRITALEGGSLGATSFLGLADTFATYAGRTNQLLYVDSASTVNSMASTVFATAESLANYVPKTGTTTITGSLYATNNLSAPNVCATTYINLPIAGDSIQGTVIPDGDTTHFLDGKGAWTVPPGAPGGSTTQVQFNDTSTFNGDPRFIWDNTAKRLSVSAISATTYENVPTASLATTAANGLIPAFTSNNQRNYFAGNGSWTYFSGVSGTSASEGFLKLAGDNQSIVGAALRSTDTRLTYGATITKGITIIEPTSLDDITMFICPDGQTYNITDYYFILMGTSPSVSCSFYTNTSRKTYDNLIDSFNLSSDSTYQVGSVLGEIAGGSLTAGGMLWVKINSVGGTVTEFHTTVTLTRTG